MRRRRTRAWLWGILAVAAAHSAAAQSPANQSPAPQSSAPDQPDANANHPLLRAYLVPPKPEKPCPPNVDVTYRADVIVTGTDIGQRPWGFAQTFRTVLVKASGDPHLKDDPRVAQLAEHAGDSVLCFDYVDMMAGIPIKDEQGTYDRPHRLTVTFEPEKIDQFLADFGDKPWRGERPVIVPVLLIKGPKPPPYLLSLEAPRGGEQRGAFATWAGELDTRLRIPSEAQLVDWGYAVDRFPANPPTSPDSEAIVAGTLEWSETLPGWIGRWHCRWNGIDHAWGISGVSYDAAFRDIIGGVMQLA